MTTLGKILRTTAFRLTLLNLAIFAVVATAILGYVAWNSRRLVEEGIRSTIEAEINGLSEQYRQGGIRRLVHVIERRSRSPGSNLYLLTAFNGTVLAGNVTMPGDRVLEPGPQAQELVYRRFEDAAENDRLAIVRMFQLPGGFRLLVGRDVEELERLRFVVRRAFGWSIVTVVVVGFLGGFFVARRVLRRVDSMTDTTRAIMQGDLSGRLAVVGSNDELDRLALALNAMLDRIGELMAGLREVSDNVAHDLRTPLTRLRNAAEQALRTGRDEADCRQALEHVIEESDGLIRVFNSLLMIARAEAGRMRESMAPFDLAEVARSLAELYEPVAEEAGVRLAADLPDTCPLTGNRELIGQAVSNLIDNALKYGRPQGAASESDAPKTDAPKTDAPKTDAPEVRLTVARRGAIVEIAVGDRGPGIPAADRERVLDRFVRLEGSRTRPGFGLGLSLVNAVVRLHGGQLRLEDNGPGLRCVMELPAGSETAA